MAQFSYVARDAEGAVRSGVLEAPDQAAALRSLSDQFEIVTRLDPADPAGGRGLNRLGSRRISAEELMVFTQQLAAMTEGGVTLPRAFDILVQETRNPSMRDTVVDLSGQVRGGGTLAGGMQRHPSIFPRFYTSLIEAGEKSGNLPMVLFRLAAYLERAEKVRRQVVAALVYPSIVLVFAFLTVATILLLGVPQISGVYEQLGRPLPVLTRIFVDVCMGLARTWYVGLGLLAVGAVALRQVLGTETGRRWSERLLLATWPFSGVAQDLAMARFTHTLATLYASGIRFSEALDLVAAGVGFHAYGEEIQRARSRVEDGEPLSVALRRGRLFSGLLVGMIAAGEESGTLDRMLERLADVFEARVEVALRALVSALEPILIIGIGLMIAAILLILGLPFLSLSSTLS